MSPALAVPKRAVVVLSTLLAVPAFSAQKPGAAGPPPPAPEVKRTTDAVVGRWAGHMTATVPGEKPETFAWDIESTAAALGWGAACTMKGQPSIGPIAQTCLVAYDPEGKAVHYMCVTSMREVHDHKGWWTAENTIEFAPLQGFLMGKPIVETVS